MVPDVIIRHANGWLIPAPVAMICIIDIHGKDDYHPTVSTMFMKMRIDPNKCYIFCYNFRLQREGVILAIP